MRGNFLLRPGTLFIVILGLVVGLGIYNWSEQLFPSTEENDSSQAVDCSTLRLRFVDQQDNGTHYTVFIQTNRDQPYAVTFHGDERNITRIVKDPAQGSVTELTAPISPIQDLKAKVNGCSRVFRP